MRIYLLFCFLITSLTASFAQEAVTTGDTMLCSNGSGTAMVQGIVPYDSYQWQVKAYLATAFVDIEGATSSTFTYDAYTYSVTYIRCRVSQDGNSFYSNELFIDSMVSLPIFYSSDTNGPVTINPENGGYLICPGGTITNTIMGGTSYQWFKNDEPISGANSATYVVTGPGVYYAAVSMECDGFSYTLPQEVVANPICNPGGVEPVIAGDTMLCPGGEGTAGTVNNMAFDTYQWQVRDYNPENPGEFTNIEGATSASFTYGQYDYAVKEIRLVVTLDGQTYYSNILMIDSLVFAGLTVEHTTYGQVSTDPLTGAFLLCGDAASVSTTVFEPYTIVQWYKDGEPIEGATEMTYLAVEPGDYYVVGSPAECPDYSETLPTFTLAMDPECVAGIDTPNAAAFTLYPNPANTTLNISLPNGSAADSYTIVDVTGKTLMSGALNSPEPTINIQALAQGSYIIKVTGAGTQTSKMFVKQ
jgi:Secretion system C-terminal sorting domain